MKEDLCESLAPSCSFSIYQLRGYYNIPLGLKARGFGIDSLSQYLINYNDQRSVTFQISKKLHHQI
jgi:hypothetical protein